MSDCSLSGQLISNKKDISPNVGFRERLEQKMKAYKQSSFVNIENATELLKGVEGETKFGYFYQEVSAKTGDNVKRAIKTMATKIVEDIELAK
jgi:hypothetical protein